MSSPAKKPTANKPVRSSAELESIEAAWTGPLPPPTFLKQFDDILENGAERIFQMAEKEQQHRIDAEKNKQASDIAAQKMEYAALLRGHWLGATVSALSILASMFTSYIGAHPSVSIALVGVPLMSAVRAIILRK